MWQYKCSAGQLLANHRAHRLGRYNIYNILPPLHYLNSEEIIEIYAFRDRYLTKSRSCTWVSRKGTKIRYLARVIALYSVPCIPAFIIAMHVVRLKFRGKSL